LAAAELRISVEATNVSRRPVEGELRAEIEDLQCYQRVRLSPGETRLVEFMPQRFPQLRMRNPRVWWPHPVGPQELYQLRLSFRTGGEISDAVQVRFGIRMPPPLSGLLAIRGPAGPSEDRRVRRPGAPGHPTILTSKGYLPGLASEPRQWRTARWTGKTWELRDFTRSDHNYGFRSLCIDPDGLWRVIAPAEPGPQPYCTGGEMVLWTSDAHGRTWRRVEQFTRHSRWNHSYARKPVNAHPGFYAIWADGNPLEPSDSSFYFTDKGGTRVWRLPFILIEELERPLEVR